MPPPAPDQDKDHPASSEERLTRLSRCEEMLAELEALTAGPAANTTAVSPTQVPSIAATASPAADEPPMKAEELASQSSFVMPAFDELDVNGDGIIDRAEFERGMSSIPALPPQRSRPAAARPVVQYPPVEALRVPPMQQALQNSTSPPGAAGQDLARCEGILDELEHVIVSNASRLLELSEPHVSNTCSVL